MNPKKMVTVAVERNGAHVEVEVTWDKAEDAMTELLALFARLTEDHPELIPQLETVHGGMQQISDPFVDGFGHHPRRIGFR